MSRDLTTAYRDEKNKLEGDAIIRLFKIYTSTPLYLAEYDKDVVFNGQTYIATPMTSAEVSENTIGSIDSITIGVGNADRNMIAMIQGQDFIDVRVDMLEVYANNLSDPNAYIKDVYYISNISVTTDAAVFTLDSLLMRVGLLLPKRTYSKGTCQFKFKSIQCGFGAEYRNITFNVSGTKAWSTISWPNGTIYGQSTGSGSYSFAPEFSSVYVYYTVGSVILNTINYPTKFSRSQVYIPLCKYNGGTDIEYYWSQTVNVTDYPNADINTCDFTLSGDNGCMAHNNKVRFGGFP